MLQLSRRNARLSLGADEYARKFDMTVNFALADDRFDRAQ
jgi:hypothetical protein